MSGNRSKSAIFEGGWVTLNADFREKGASPTNHSWYQSSRVIAVSCGIKISAVRHLVLSQSTRVTDRRTDRQMDRQNYDSQDRPRICSRSKNVFHVCCTPHIWTVTTSAAFHYLYIFYSITENIKQKRILKYCNNDGNWCFQLLKTLFVKTAL